MCPTDNLGITPPPVTSLSSRPQGLYYAVDALLLRPSHDRAPRPACCFMTVSLARRAIFALVSCAQPASNRLTHCSGLSPSPALLARRSPAAGYPSPDSLSSRPQQRPTPAQPGLCPLARPALLTWEVGFGFAPFHLKGKIQNLLRTTEEYGKSAAPLLLLAI